MGPERMRRSAGVLLALLCLVSALEAQGRKGKRRAPQHPPADSPKGDKGGGENAPFPPYLQGGQTKAPTAPGGKGGAKAGGKAGKAGAPGAAAPAGPPVQEADRVTATADLLAAREVELERELKEHFKLCDLDGNGWISLREAEVTLSYGRADYRRVDEDQDGRIAPAEFARHGDELLTRLGAAPPPAPETSEPAREPPATPDAETAEPEPTPAEAPAPALSAAEAKGLFPRPQDLLRRYDADASKGLDTAEITRLCSELGQTLSPELVVEQMDPNENGQLEARELGNLCWIVSQHLPEAMRPALTPPPAPEPEPAPEVAAADEKPHGDARSRALTHFRRLDASEDGVLDETDLRALQSPARLDVRLEAVLSALDANGDGHLTEDEFHASMGRPGPR